MKRAVLSALLLLVGAPSTAFAFKEFRQFGMTPLPEVPADPMLEPDPPGGGGRYFTGSLSDGHTCAVCHFGGPAPDSPLSVTINPDPFEDGYRSGVEYTIAVSLPYMYNPAGGTDPTGSYAANFELVDLAGHGAGTITVEETPCTIAGADPIGAHVADLESPSRQVAGMSDCGPTLLRATWTAPDTATGPVWINVAGVSTDSGNDSPHDDTTSTYARIVPPLGGAPEAGRVDSTCNATAGRPARTPSLLLLVALGALLRRARPRK